MVLRSQVPTCPGARVSDRADQRWVADVSPPAIRTSSAEKRCHAIVFYHSRGKLGSVSMNAAAGLLWVHCTSKGRAKAAKRGLTPWSLIPRIGKICHPRTTHLFTYEMRTLTTDQPITPAARAWLDSAVQFNWLRYRWPVGGIILPMRGIEEPHGRTHREYVGRS